MDINSVTQKAEDLARKYNSEGYSPFPYDKIEEDLANLQILFSDKLDADVSGAILYDDELNSFVVLVNKSKSDTKIHFTIAHCLGHYFLHKDFIMRQEGKIIVDTDNNLAGRNYEQKSYDQNRLSFELEANDFAASLIMPERLVRNVWEKLHDITECAKVFKVSVSSMSLRLERLNII